MIATRYARPFVRTRRRRYVSGFVPTAQLLRELNAGVEWFWNQRGRKAPRLQDFGGKQVLR